MPGSQWEVGYHDSQHGPFIMNIHILSNIKHNDIQYNATLDNDIKHCSIKHNGIQHGHSA
jgi:hypothetical protein